MHVVAIGQVNDPEKVKKEKERKRNDSVWAEPKNNVRSLAQKAHTVIDC
jgi:hypothetical protein